MVVNYHFLKRYDKVKPKVVEIPEINYSREHYFNQYVNSKNAKGEIVRKPVVIFDEENQLTKNFLNNIYASMNKLAIQTGKIQLLDGQTFYQTANETIKSHIHTRIQVMLAEQQSGSKEVKSWVDCLEGCQEILKDYIEVESISTAYYVRLFANSIIHINLAENNTEPLKLQIYYNYGFDLNSLTGKIEDDHHKFYITWNTNLLENSQAGGDKY